MYWRKFHIKDIPLGDIKQFDLWMRERWVEKDALMEQYITTGRFPASPPATGAANGIIKEGHIETEVKLAHWWEVGSIFVILGAAALVCNILVKFWNLIVHGRQ